MTKTDRVTAVAAAAAHTLNNDLTVILSSVADSMIFLEPGHPARPLLTDLQLAAERCAMTAEALLAMGRRAGVRATPAPLLALVEN